MTLTECAVRLDFELKNPVSAGWVFEARDGTLVVTLWKHFFEDERTYDTLKQPAVDGSPARRRKARERIEQFKKLGSNAVFSSILMTPYIGGGTDRVKDREIGPKMRLERFDEATCQFRAHRID